MHHIEINIALLDALAHPI